MSDQNIELALKILAGVIPAFGVIGLLLQLSKHRIESRLTKLDVSKRITKLIEPLGDEWLKKLNEELVKDELFFYRTGMNFNGQLRKAFTEQFSDLLKHFNFNQMHLIRSYYKLEKEKLAVKSRSEMWFENFFIIFYWTALILLLLAALLLTFFIEVNDIVRIALGSFAGIALLPIFKQFVIISLLKRHRKYFDSLEKLDKESLNDIPVTLS